MEHPTLDNDTFDDQAIATMSVGLCARRDNGRVTNAVDILVRPVHVSCDESGSHPGEKFVLLHLTREEVRSALHFLEEDWATQVELAGDPNEKRGPRPRISDGARLDFLCKQLAITVAHAFGWPVNTWDPAVFRAKVDEEMVRGK